jgi:hypothetical protein
MNEIKYSFQLEQLLKDEAEIAESLSVLHRMSYVRYNTFSSIVSIPIIVISSMTGYMTALDLGWDNSSVFLGSLSILVGIIRSIEAYFGWGKRSESHRISSLQYAKTNKLIAVELALQSGDRIAAKDLLNIIKQDLQTLAEYAPMLDDTVIEKFKTVYGKYPTKKSNLTNGLTTIYINNAQQAEPPEAIIVNGGGEEL